MFNEIEKKGFVILKNVFFEDTLDRIRKLQTKIVTYAEANLEDPFSMYYLRHRSDQGVLYDLYQRHPEFRELVSEPKVVHALETVLGPNIYMYENSLIYKPKGKKNGVPWHQDFISRPSEPVKYIVWIPLDNVDKGNGTLKVIPGSHAQGFLPWYRVEGETHHDRVVSEYIEKNKNNIVYIEMNAGDILVFNMLIVHGSDEVHTDRPRRVYRCSFQSMNDQVFTPRGAPLVIAGGDPDYLSNQYHKRFIHQKKKTLFLRGVNKIGRILEGYGSI